LAAVITALSLPSAFEKRHQFLTKLHSKNIGEIKKSFIKNEIKFGG
jgi:hypothetical protein